MCQHAHPPAIELADLLDQLAAMIGRLDDGHYRAERAVGVSGSIGGHVRHCLDHVAALVHGIPSGRIDYDRRVRGTAVESQRSAAVREAAALREAVAGLHDSTLEAGVEVRIGNGREVTAVVSSSVGRELAFVASHTVHHFAVIALLLRDMGIAVPRRFGYARSTPTPELAA